jgi:hypothetical protein
MKKANYKAHDINKNWIEGVLVYTGTTPLLQTLDSEHFVEIDQKSLCQNLRVMYKNSTLSCYEYDVGVYKHKNEVYYYVLIFSSHHGPIWLSCDDEYEKYLTLNEVPTDMLILEFTNQLEYVGNIKETNINKFKNKYADES